MSVLQYHLGDAMEAGALRTITDVVTLDARLDWFTYLPVLREAALLYKSEVSCIGADVMLHAAHRGREACGTRKAWPSTHCT